MESHIHTVCLQSVLSPSGVAKDYFNKLIELSGVWGLPYDCVINFLLRATSPSSSPRYLSRPEQEVMETYTSASLVAGIIHPSSSFFVEKKNTTLCPVLIFMAQIT